MDQEQKKRKRWKIRNLGYFGYLRSLWQKKRYVEIVPEEISEDDNVVDLIGDWYPFMLVKPCGVQKLEYIRSLLKKFGLMLKEERWILDYNEAIPILFPSVDKRKIMYWRQINRNFYEEGGKCKACVLMFEKDCDIGLLTKVKRLIRRSCGIDFFYIRDGERPIYETSITPVHVPDPEDMQMEFSRVMKYCNH